MAITFVQCTDVNHAAALHVAGLLYLNCGIVGAGDAWRVSSTGTDVRDLYNQHDGLWPPSEFAYAVED